MDQADEDVRLAVGRAAQRREARGDHRGVVAEVGIDGRELLSIHGDLDADVGHDGDEGHRAHQLRPHGHAIVAPRILGIAATLVGGDAVVVLGISEVGAVLGARQARPTSDLRGHQLPLRAADATQVACSTDDGYVGQANVRAAQVGAESRAHRLAERRGGVVRERQAFAHKLLRVRRDEKGDGDGGRGGGIGKGHHWRRDTGCLELALWRAVGMNPLGDDGRIYSDGTEATLQVRHVP